MKLKVFSRKYSKAVLLFSAFYNLASFGVLHMSQPELWIKELGLDPYKNVEGLEQVTVCVIDSGFASLRSESIRKDWFPNLLGYIDTFPKELDQILGLEKIITAPLDKQVDHGTLAAQIVRDLTRRRAKLLLMNGASVANVQRSLEYCGTQGSAEGKGASDIIIYAQSDESRSDFTGLSSDFNPMFERAASRGSLIVVAAGNYGDLVYNGPVQWGDNRYVRFHNGKTAALRIQSPIDNNVVEIILSWNRPTKHVDLDLDLYIEDPKGRRLNVEREGTIRQIMGTQPTQANESYLAQEVVTVTLNRTRLNEFYRVRVKAVSGEGR